MRKSIKFLVIYNLHSDNYLVIWELDGLGLQHVIVSIVGSKILKDLLDSLCISAHILRTLSNIQAGKGFCLDGG